MDPISRHCAVRLTRKWLRAIGNGSAHDREGGRFSEPPALQLPGLSGVAVIFTGYRVSLRSGRRSTLLDEPERLEADSQSLLMEHQVQSRTPFLLSSSLALLSVEAKGRWRERGRMGRRF